MDKIAKQLFFKSYSKLIIISILVQIVFRVSETVLIVINYGIQDSLYISEFKGLLLDLLLACSLLILALPVYYLIYRFSEKVAINFFIVLILFFVVLHFFIIKYFVYQLMPLDTFVYQYSIREIIFTLSTSDVGFLIGISEMGLLLVVIVLFIRFIKKIELSLKLSKTIHIICLISLPVFLYLSIIGVNLNKFAENKSYYFFSNSILYLFKEKPGTIIYTADDTNAFRKMYHGKSFISKEYPLLHSFENNHTLDTFFKHSDTVPNIVILIVEGLNDDFIHSYKGVSLMPFLQELKDSSLYWNRCFTLGERSFAVVPSLLGSLPYGETGFTLLEKLPRHISLVSLLHANGYYTSFFYGQGSWFHKKDRFFKFNNIDLIFDNKKFSDKYEKIIVGDDHFFWGYNDKDLFRQSFEVLDTLKAKRRLDIYYTGTSHSPFILDDVRAYNKKFSELLKSLNNEQDLRFFQTYKKFIRSVLFVDDALKEYFEKVKNLPGYDNTIFLITGDHPMTEIPIGNSLKRYHIPLIIYSPGLINAKTFSQTVSHLDVYESLMSLLSSYPLNIPDVSTALGDELNTGKEADGKRIAFMNDNREIIDFYSNGYFLSGKQLFSVGEDLTITPLGDRKILRTLKSELEVFRNTSLYTSINDKILNDSLYCNELGYQMINTARMDTGYVTFNTEYYNLIKPVKLENRPFFYDVSFDYSGKLNDDFIFVYQLSTKNDSIIYWKSNRLSENAKSFQVHNHIPKQNVSDSILYFNSYFRNKGRKNIRFEKLKILLYMK